jgi:hypothetical protein
MRMDDDDFIRWAFDDARTLEERYATELLVEHALIRWHAKHQTGHFTRWELVVERKRQRFLNPAYQPEYSEENVRRAAEILPELTEWELAARYQERPVRDMAVLRFLPALQTLTVDCDIVDLSLLSELPNLRTLTFNSPICEDYRPLARCTGLQHLHLSLAVHWPEIEGLENLQQLETLTLSGNLLVFTRGLTFPRVRQGGLNCTPLFARSLRELPQLPACEFLTLSGIERLDGIEAMPRLRNLTLRCAVRDFRPLAGLRELTWFSQFGTLPLDVTPIAQIPRLLFAHFETQHVFGIDSTPLRDYSPLMSSPMLRELHVRGCPPVEMEVAALNAALPTWDDLLLAPEPRLIPPLRMIVAPSITHPQRHDLHRCAEEPDLNDKGVRDCEGRWVGGYIARIISECIGHADWGKVEVQGDYRTFTTWVECYEVVERLPEIVEAVRKAMAGLRYEYLGQILVCLRVPPPEPTEAHAEMLRRFRNEQDDADFERRQKDEMERLERLYLYQLKQQQGDTVDPKQFAPPPREPSPPAPWEIENDEEDDESGDLVVKKKPEPPADPWDDEHPLADNYRLMATCTVDAFWVDSRFAPLAIHLMRREPDEVLAGE